MNLPSPQSDASAQGRKPLLGLALLLSLCAIGCALTTFTRGYRDNLGMSDREVQQLQFFTSGEIVLQRQSAIQERANVGSAFNVTSKTKIEEVVIPSGTPGVALQIVHVPNDDAAASTKNGGLPVAETEYILVSFSPKEPDKALWFSTQRAKIQGRYELIHVARMEEKDGKPKPLFSPGFLVKYGGKDYHVEDSDMWQVHLVFDEDFITDEEISRQSPPGWRLRNKGKTSSSTTSVGIELAPAAPSTQPSAAPTTAPPAPSEPAPATGSAATP